MLPDVEQATDHVPLSIFVLNKEHPEPTVDSEGPGTLQSRFPFDP